MDTVVIGAGLSGLAAAMILHEAGASVRVVEADDRIGGRIHALRDPQSDRPLADLGPTWVWPKYQPVATRWLDHLGAVRFEQFNHGDAVIVGYGPAPQRQPLPGQDGMVRIAGGPISLIDALVARLGRERIQTSAAVIEIVDDESERISLRLRSGEIITADQVIVSVPLRVASETIHMPWAPPALISVMQRTPTWMSTHAKAVAVYERPFWRDHGLSGRIASRAGPLVEVHDHSSHDDANGALFGFVGWPPERRRQDPEGLIAAILDQLASCFGPVAAHPVEIAIQDWALAPHIVTELDLSQPADHPDVPPRIVRAAQLGGRVRFAVSEASEISPGLIEGAFASGERAAREVLETAR